MENATATQRTPVVRLPPVTPIALLEPADEARIVALQQTDERQAALIADLTRRLAIVEAAPRLTGWSYWLHQGLASRKFQAWAVTVLTALGALLGGQITGTAFLIGVVTATVAWLGAEAAVDSAERSAQGKVAVATLMSAPPPQPPA